MVSLIFLAGGRGARMGSSVPKQYLPLQDKPIALHSFEGFIQIPSITEIVVVCESEYQHFFSIHPVLFAPPGLRRQDSVYSGLKKCTKEIILIHDSARPFFEAQYIAPLIEAAKKGGAAGLAAPVTSTIKQCGIDYVVEKTLDRTLLWEMQTPQAAKRELLLKAYEHIEENHLEVTDDLAAIETLNHPVQIVPCTARNLKITTPFDLAVAKTLCAIN